MNSKVKTVLAVMAVQLLALMMISMTDFSPKNAVADESTPLVIADKRSYNIDVRTLGELEAERSVSVASAIRTEQPKVIDLIPDGTNVNTGDLLVKIDALPFETKIQELKASIEEQDVVGPSLLLFDF